MLNVYKVYRHGLTGRNWDRVDSYVAIAANEDEALYGYAIRMAAFEHMVGIEYDEDVYQELEVECGRRCMPVTADEAVQYSLTNYEWEVTVIGKANSGHTEPSLVCMDYCAR